MSNIFPSVSQHTFSAKDVLQNEANVAERLNISLYSLMEKAGLAVFKEIYALPIRRKQLLVVCGKGNNGGDGFVIARLASEAGFDVSTLILTAENTLAGDALTAFNKLKKQSKNIQFIDNTSDLEKCIDDIQLSPPEVIVDAIFGIGFYGELPALHHKIITKLNQISANKIAVDVPSGVNANSGYVANIAFEADQTISFIASKKGLYTGASANFTGEIKLKSLGLTEAFCHNIATNTYLQTYQNLPLREKRKKTIHKGSIGLLLAIGGNEGFAGAIKLASTAALRSGSALVSVASHLDSRMLVHSQTPELMIAGHDKYALTNNMYLLKTKLLLLGPGLGQNIWANTLFDYALSLDKPLVIDADGLQLLSQKPTYRNDWVLTPHSGEAAKLLNCSIEEIEQDRFTAVANICKKYGGICVLKGSGTLISDGKNCWINTSGNPSMASGGMGDVLSGIIAAHLMQMSDKLEAVRLAVFLHGYIADKIVEQQGEIGLLASDIVNKISRYINKII